MARRLEGGHREAVLSLDVNHNLLVSGGEKGELALWDIASETLINTQTPFPQLECLSVCFIRNNDNYICTAFGNQVIIFDKRDITRAVCTVASCEDEVNQIVASSDGAYMAACLDNGDVNIYKNATDAYSPSLSAFRTLRNKHTNICSTICFRHGKATDLFSGGCDCQLIHWDFMKVRSLNMFNMQEIMHSSNSGSYMINPPFIHHLDVSPDGNILACGVGNGYVSLFDCSKRHIRHTRDFVAHSSHVSQIKFLNAYWYVTGGNDSNIHVWSAMSEASIDDADSGAVASPHINGNHQEAGDQERDQATTTGLPDRSINHGSKINWFAAKVNPNVSIIVADQSSTISVYSDL